VAAEYEPGDFISYSGIYSVTQAPAHAQPYEVTCTYGSHFPLCSQCRRPRFTLMYSAVR
jgi:hypothetical protein